MERMTMRIDGEAVFCGCTGPCSTCGGVLCENVFPVIDRLAAYEDTGLEPEEVLIGKELAEVACAINLLKEYQSVGPVERFRELVQAEKDGRLVVQKYGRWIRASVSGIPHYRCSSCGEYIEAVWTANFDYKYCPNCGAKIKLY